LAIDVFPFPKLKDKRELPYPNELPTSFVLFAAEKQTLVAGSSGQKRS